MTTDNRRILAIDDTPANRITQGNRMKTQPLPTSPYQGRGKPSRRHRSPLTRGDRGVKRVVNRHRAMKRTFMQLPCLITLVAALTGDDEVQFAHRGQGRC